MTKCQERGQGMVAEESPEEREGRRAGVAAEGVEGRGPCGRASLRAASRKSGPPQRAGEVPYP